MRTILSIFLSLLLSGCIIIDVFDSTIASEHRLCKLDEVALKQMKKELSNVGEFDNYYFREDSSLKNLSTGERLSICSDVDIVYCGNVFS